MRSRAHRNPLSSLLMLLSLLALGGCDRAVETRTVEEVRLEFAQRIVDGVEFGLSGFIQAESFDETTLTLRHVRIDGGPDQIVAADAAEIIVDPAADTVSLRLVDVVGASVAGGGIGEADVKTAGPVKLRYNVIADVVR
jgi:hypothetical protein